MNGNEYNNNNKDFRRNDDTSGYMFLNDKYNDNSIPEPRNISEAISEMSEILEGYRQMEQEEKIKNGGKMISNQAHDPRRPDPYAHYLPEGASKVAALVIVAVVFTAPFILMLINKPGCAFGVFYICAGLLLSFKDVSRRRTKLPLAVVFLLFGIAMMISDFLFEDKMIIAALFLGSLLPIIMANDYLTSYRKKMIRDIATYQIEAECVKHVTETISFESSPVEVVYPVYEITYLGMTKRLRGYQTYINLPNIGERRMIYINPKDFDEWYDPSAN